ncbi:MAG: hypothetical protein WCT49_05885 [Candidatus Paceibacterota bacterium]|jgi:hypothetical protein|nr:hypothetical protein [Candidatus Paceibacterota bacterium]
MPEKYMEGREHEPAIRINEKGIDNSYTRNHLFQKEGITEALIRKCLDEGKIVTPDHPKEGAVYVKLDVPDAPGLPGRIELPQYGGSFADRVANLNVDCHLELRNGKISYVVEPEDIPPWLTQYSPVFCVILEKNEARNGKIIKCEDGPRESDPEGSWLVATAFYGEPSMPKPRVPNKKDLENPEKLAAYLHKKDEWERKESKTIYVSKKEKQIGLSREEEDESYSGMRKLQSAITAQRELIEQLLSEQSRLRNEISRMKKKSPYRDEAESDLQG